MLNSGTQLIALNIKAPETWFQILNILLQQSIFMTKKATIKVKGGTGYYLLRV